MWSVFKDVLPLVIRLGRDIAKSISKGNKESQHEPKKILPFYPDHKPILRDPGPFPDRYKDPMKSINGDSVLLQPLAVAC